RRSGGSSRSRGRRLRRPSFRRSSRRGWPPMPRTIGFDLDEHCDPAIAAGLRLHGVDVSTTVEAGFLHSGGEDHLAYARGAGRVVFTQDQDFLKLNAAGAPHRGIAFCPQRSRSIGQIIAGLLLIWEIYEPEEMANRVEYL